MKVGRIKIEALKVFFIYLFFVFILIEETLPMGQLFTLFSLFGMVALSITEGIKIRKWDNKAFEIHIILLLLYCILSMLWAQSRSRTMGVVRALSIILLMMSALHFSVSRRTTLSSLLNVIVYGGYSVIVYSIIRYGWSSIVMAISEEFRISNEFMNANTLGMCAAYAIVVDIMSIMNSGFRLRNLLSIPSFIIIGASGSRKALIIIIIGTIGGYIIKNMHDRQVMRRIAKLIGGLLFFGVIVFFLLQMPVFSGIRNRMDGFQNVLLGTASRNTAGYARMVYVQIGWNLFREHPIFGIGIHNASLYIGHLWGHVHLHNTMVELLACGGILGFIAYYWAYIYLLVQFWKYRKYRDDEYNLCLLLLCIRFVMSYGYIEYFSAISYFYFLIFWLKIEKIKNTAKAKLI